MSDQISDLDRSKQGVAILAACVVQTLNESDPSFEERFLERLSLAYDHLKEGQESDVLHQMELLSWTRDLLIGFNRIIGKGTPFLA